MNMTKKEMLDLAKRNIRKAELCKVSGQFDMYQVFMRNAKLYIKQVNRRIYQEKLQRQVMMFPTHVMYESIMVSPIPNRFMFEARNINWSI